MILSKCDASINLTIDSVLVQWTTAHGQSDAPPPGGSTSSKQHEWDKPSIAADLARLNTSLPERHHQAHLLAVSAPHSSDWLHALPISSCGLRLDDDAVRVAIGRLGARLCEPHQCPCCAKVGPEGTYGLTCGRSAPHSKWPRLTSSRPRQCACSMTWDVTVTDTFAESYIQVTSSTAGADAEGAADRKELKY